ncbi:MAG: glycosyltransferase family 4 protein [Oscillospiraceae bacterium]|nr:glycosyltransferase family 4 protein [Oscillospiraceae bacterium]
MNIFIVSMCFYPDDFRINDIAAQMAADGNHVTVLTGLPDYATSRIPRAFRFFRRRRESWRGVNIIRVPIVARRSGKIFRALNYLSFVISGGLYARFCRRKADIVFSYQTSPVLQSMPAIAFSRRRRIPLIIYCCDIWPECLKVWNIREDSALFRWADKRSRKIYRRADLLPVTSEPFAEYLAERHGIPRDRMPVLPQHAEDLYGEIAGVFEDNDCVDFVFAGNIGAAQCVDGIIRAAALMPDGIKSFMIHIIGDGSERSRCEQLAEELGLSNQIIFHGKHPLDLMPFFYRIADCFLLTLSGDGVGTMTLPAKAQSYMSAGKPILAAADGASSAIIAESKCGWCVPANDPQKLAAAMEVVINTSREKLIQYGNNGREYYERKYTKEEFMDALYLMINDTIRWKESKQSP